MKINFFIFSFISFCLSLNLTCERSEFESVINKIIKHGSNFRLTSNLDTIYSSEIIDYSDENETAVCNLASISLPAFVNDDKTFDYDRTHPLAILQSVKEVKAWDPDVILGPRNSNMFLLTRGVFKNVLVSVIGLPSLIGISRIVPEI